METYGLIEVNNDKNRLRHLQSGDLGLKYFCCFSAMFCLEETGI